MAAGGISVGDVERIGAYLRLRGVAAALVDVERIGAGLRHDSHHAVEMRAPREESGRHHDAPAEVVAAGSDIGIVLTVEDVAHRVAHGVVDHVDPHGVSARAVGVGGSGYDAV